MGGKLLGALAGTALVLAVTATASPAATIHVDTETDELNADGDCSLREAVQSANDNASVDECERGSASADTVRLENGEQYSLTIPSTNESANANGDLDYYGGGPLTIRGNHRSIQGSGIEARPDDRVIEATNDSDALTVSHLNLAGGDVSEIPFSADAVGGAIKVNAVPLTVTDINLEGGKADQGGGIYASVFDEDKEKISDSYLADSAATETGGVIHVNSAKSLKLTDVGVASNEAVGQNVKGGGLYTNTKTTITDSDFQFNEASTTFASGTSEGGAIYSGVGKLTVTGSTFSSNYALDVQSSSHARGGAIYAGVGKFDVTNSTFFRNDSEERGGAIYSFVGGSASFATFTENGADDTGDVLQGGEVKLTGSIFDGAGLDNCASGTFKSKGYNVFVTEDLDCGFGGKDELIPEVGFADGQPLNNGGPTFTMSLEKESAARNVMPKGKCKDVTKTDQRGYKRPGGKKCDAGAYERGAKKP